MNNTIKLVIDYQKNQDNDIFEKLVEQLKEILRFKFYKIPLKDQDDLYQEMLIGLNKLINNFKVLDNYIVNNHLFENDNLIKYQRYGVGYIKEEFDINYLDGFIDKYSNDLFIKAFKDKESKELFIYEYNLFCNENQFKRLLILKCESMYIDYLRHNKSIIDDIFINEEIVIDKKKEFIDIPKEDKELLEMIMKDKLTEQQVADKLGITQQAVNKRKKKIIDKLKK